MKISNNTLNILSNFSILNNGILVKKGSELVTVSSQKTVLANAIVPESFEQEFCFYNLSQFLGAVSLFDNPDFDFHENGVTISDGKNQVTYIYAEPKTVVLPPMSVLDIGESFFEFDLSKDQFSSLAKAAAVLTLPNVTVSSSDGKVQMGAEDVKNPSSNRFDIQISDVKYEGGDFRMTFKLDNLKLIPNDYHVSVSFEKFMANFSTKNLDYWVAVEQADSFLNTK